MAKGKGKVDSGGDGCSHCGNINHNCETYFKQHGYQELWKKIEAQKQKETTATGSQRPTVAKGEPHLRLVSQVCPNNVSISKLRDQANGTHVLIKSSQADYSGWIIVSGAIDPMTFCPPNFVESTQPR
ncbi:hypothetical protein Nepgr_031025 [Nepenthes gracilis]|uniref:Uncharacterized protein n=1 Tax=Nepenthes gracilis TaxID=150966 RepID=A0AAD3TGS2_NEPGR|nr:hypothetical protein Nepgr_031025 [Nepenthes gracilis]